MTMQHYEKVLYKKTHPSLTFICLHGQPCLLCDIKNDSAVQITSEEFVKAQRWKGEPMQGQCK